MAGLNLPSPAKTVHKSVGVCRRAGMTRVQALNTVVHVCESVAICIGDQSEPLKEWIRDVREIAVTAAANGTTETIEDWRG